MLDIILPPHDIIEFSSRRNRGCDLQINVPQINRTSVSNSNPFINKQKIQKILKIFRKILISIVFSLLNILLSLKTDEK
jgi:hypothetical protein